MTDEERWAGYLVGAQAQTGRSSPLAPVTGIKGRWIVFLATKLCEFWLAHKATLLPYLTNLAIAALDALVAHLAEIATVNLPGPQ